MKKRIIALTSALLISLQCGIMNVFAVEDEYFVDCDEPGTTAIEIKASKVDDTDTTDEIVPVNVIGYQVRFYTVPIRIKKTTLYGKVWNPSKLAYENSNEVYDIIYDVETDENYLALDVGTLEFENFSNCSLQVNASYEANENFENLGVAPQSCVVPAAYEMQSTPGKYGSSTGSFEDFFMTRPSSGFNQEKLKNMYDAIGDAETTIGRIVVRVSVAE